MSKARRARTIAGLLGLTLGAAVLYVGAHALQEDVTLSRHSPLRWVLVDSRLRQLELGPELQVQGFYYTVGDGPKLPGSDVTLAGPLSATEVMRRARDALAQLGFEPEPTLCWPTECHFSGPRGSANVYVVEDGPGARVRIFMSG